MALYNFPDSPSNADTVTINGITYTYNSTKAYWTSSAGSSGSGGGASVSTSDSAPSSPSDGDLWYDTDDGGMFVYYADGSSNQWVEVVGQQGSAGAAGAAGATGAAGSATVVANVTALLALSSPAAGDQAFVTATNTLYFYNGSGWYKIALINTTPSISGASATYDLASDGTATTVTITATDPEGIPITYSIASDTSGNIATVAQGTGASTNVWTITPSTNNAHAGTFSLTFRASDGVNIATAASSFTLQFIVTNSHYTTALITSVGANNAVNTSFDDKSTNDHTITANGDVHQTTFSPYRHGGYSAHGDGSDAVKFNETAADEFTFGSDSFTIEFWVWIDLDSVAAGGEHTLVGNNGTDGELWISHIGTNWGGSGNGTWNWQMGSGSWAHTLRTTGGAYVETRKWLHMAFVRDGNDFEIFKNGTSIGTNTWNGSIPNTNNMLSFFGRPQTYGQYTTAYMHDLRVVKGTAVYTSNFTAPTEPLTAITNTKLLTFRKPYIVDESASPLSVTIDTGDPSVEPFTPYDFAPYTDSLHGGSAQFDGTGDYLATAADSSLTVGTGQFTLECWFQVNTDAQYTLLALMNGSTNVLNIYYYDTNDSIGVNDGSWITGNAGSGTNHDIISLNIWHHLALVRDATNMKLYVNGVERHSAANSTNYNNDRIWIGANQYGNNLLGNISDVRLVKGTAVYTSNFTPPTAPLSAITNTSLLVQSTDAGIIDKSQSSKKVKLVGNTKSSTTQYKFLSSAMYFDGTGDYLEADSQNIANFSTEDFTAEGWFWVASLPGSGTAYTVVDARSSGGNATGWTLGLGASGNIYIYNAATTISGGSVSTSTWHHWAFTRSGTNQKLFLNGTQVGSTYTTVRNFTDTKFRIAGSHSGGELFTGYQSDVRMTKGLARYTANFTAPTAALQG